MSIHLEEIHFNHDPSSATNDALNIRRNAGQALPVPEWTPGGGNIPDNSPVAYSVASTRGRVITVKARFSCSTAGHAAFEVRAVDPASDQPAGEPSGCLGFLRPLGRALNVLFGNVLGQIRPKWVQCVNGVSSLEEFALVDTRLSQVGAGVHITRWRWEYRSRASDSWTPMATSEHKVYLLVDVPTLPWTQAPFAVGNTQLPWTAVLEYACSWAHGRADRHSVAEAITRAVNGLKVITYDCTGGGSPHYISPGGEFDCSAFLQRLAGGQGWGPNVNCEDTAMMVSTFANALGCDLSQGFLGDDFALNPIIPIGGNRWHPGCEEFRWPGFVFHVTARVGDALQPGDGVYDACLQVDGDATPGVPPYAPVVPAGMAFGTPGSGEYLDALVVPADRGKVRPYPPGKRRRVA